MKPTTTSLNEWFEAAISGNIKSIRRLAATHAREFDKEDRAHRSEGLAAIHYAILNTQQPVVEALIEYEYDLRTQCEVLVRGDQSIKLDSDSTIAHLVCAVNRAGLLDFVLGFHHQTMRIMLHVNDGYLLAVDVFIRACTTDTVGFLFDDFLATEFEHLNCASERASALRVAAQHFHPITFQFICDHFDDLQVDHRVMAVTSIALRHDGTDVVQFLEQQYQSEQAAACKKYAQQIKVRGMMMLNELHKRQILSQYAVESGNHAEEEAKRERGLPHAQLARLLLGDLGDV